MSKSNGHQPVAIAEIGATAGEQIQDVDTSEREGRVDRCRSLLGVLDQIRHEFVTLTKNVRAIATLSKGINQAQQEVISVLEDTLDEGSETLPSPMYGSESERLPMTQQFLRLPTNCQEKATSTENSSRSPVQVEKNEKEVECDHAAPGDTLEQLSWESTDLGHRGTVKLHIKASLPNLVYGFLETLRQNPNIHVAELVTDHPQVIGVSLRLQRPMQLGDYLQQIKLVSTVVVHGWNDREGIKQHVFNVELVEPRSPN